MNRYHSIVWVSILGFGSGFSLLFSSQILITWLIDSGVPLDQIGWVSCLMLPYLCSFMWMPVVEYIIQKSYLSQRSVMAINFIIFSMLVYAWTFLDPVHDFGYVLGVSFLMSIIGMFNELIIFKIFSPFELPG